MNEMKKVEFEDFAEMISIEMRNYLRSRGLNDIDPDWLKDQLKDSIMNTCPFQYHVFEEINQQSDKVEGE